MTEETKKEEENIEKRIYSEARGKYTVIFGKKNYDFNFPANNTLEENLSIVAFFKSEIIKALAYNEAAKEKEEQKK